MLTSSALSFSPEGETSNLPTPWKREVCFQFSIELSSHFFNTGELELYFFVFMFVRGQNKYLAGLFCKQKNWSHWNRRKNQKFWVLRALTALQVDKCIIRLTLALDFLQRNGFHFLRRKTGIEMMIEIRVKVSLYVLCFKMYSEWNLTDNSISFISKTSLFLSYDIFNITNRQNKELCFYETNIEYILFAHQSGNSGFWLRSTFTM